MRKPLAMAALALGLLGVVQAAHAVPVTYLAALDGAAEAPPNASPGTGTVKVVIDTVANFIFYDFSFAGLLGTTTAAHIHGPTAVPGNGTAGVATTTPSLPILPLGVTSGSASGSFDTTLTSTYNAAFITANGGTTDGAEAALAQMLAAGTAYFNIHTTSFSAGEIRGFFRPQPTPVPLPAAGLLMLTGIAVLAGLRRAA